VLETGFDLFDMDVDGIITKEEFSGPLPTFDVIGAHGDGLLLQQRLMRVRITPECNADFNIIDTGKLDITPEAREMIERCMARRSVEQSRAHWGYSRAICEYRMVKLAYEAVGMARQSAAQARVCAVGMARQAAEQSRVCAEEHRQLRTRREIRDAGEIRDAVIGAEAATKERPQSRRTVRFQTETSRTPSSPLSSSSISPPRMSRNGCRKDASQASATGESDVDLISHALKFRMSKHFKKLMLRLCKKIMMLRWCKTRLRLLLI